MIPCSSYLTVHPPDTRNKTTHTDTIKVIDVGITLFLQYSVFPLGLVYSIPTDLR
jgi:hypothetical protein